MCRGGRAAMPPRLLQLKRGSEPGHLLLLLLQGMLAVSHAALRHA